MGNNTEEFFDDFSKEYEKKAKNQYFTKNLKWIINSIDDFNNKTIIDIGCGTGNLLSIIDSLSNKCDLHGFDISSKMLDKSRKKVPNASFRQGNVNQLPYEDNTFDLLLNSASFHHYEDRKLALKEMKRILKPGGKLVILDSTLDPLPISAMPHYWDYVDSKKCYSKHLKRKEFIHLFKEENFFNIKYKSYYQLIPVVHLLISGEKES